MHHLPYDRQSCQFWLIQSIFRFIFQSNKFIYGWGQNKTELSKFIQYDLFTAEQVTQPRMINMQDEFKQWHLKRYGYRNVLSGQQWGLQAAIVDRFDQLLDKRETLNRWSQGLDRFRDDPSYDKIHAMINYAAHDCLAVTKLAHAIGQPIVRKITKELSPTNSYNSFSFLILYLVHSVIIIRHDPLVVCRFHSFYVVY